MMRKKTNSRIKKTSVINKKFLSNRICKELVFVELYYHEKILRD